MKTYNHAFTIGFAVPGSTTETGTELTGADLRAAIEKRLRSMSDDEIVEACGMPFDSYEEGA